MNTLASFLRIVGLIALIGSLAPALDGSIGAAVFAAIVGIGLIIVGGAISEKKQQKKPKIGEYPRF